MNYASQSDLITRFGNREIVELSDRANVGVIDEVVVANKLADANAEIDSWLQGRYKLPLPSVPVVLTRIACDIARYHLYDDRVTEVVTQRYKDAIAFLKGVSKGDVKLGVDSENNTQVDFGEPEFTPPNRVFNRENDGGFR